MNGGGQVLLVEDNDVTRKMARVALRAEGFRVAEAGDGAGAVEQATREVPDLVLQDLVLPDMDGFTLIGRLRELPGMGETPILAFTGLISDSDDARLAAAGFDGLLAKPVEPSRLVEVIRNLLLQLTSAPLADAGALRQILVVDDDPVQLKLQKLLLSQHGFRVETATNGTEALERARSSPPDVVLSDILMPRLDGFRLTTAMREDPSLAHVPVVLITAHYVDELDRDMARRVGAQDVLLRTPKLDGVLAALDRAMAGGVQPVAEAERRRATDAYAARVTAQLERQAQLNMGLAQRASLQSAELAALAAISQALGRGVDVSGPMLEALGRCMDAAGLSRGAVLLRHDEDWHCEAQIGFGSNMGDRLAAFIADPRVRSDILESRDAIVLTVADVPRAEVASFLADAGAAMAVVAPIPAAHRNQGALLLTCANDALPSDDCRLFARTIAAQLGQALQLSQAFDQLSDSERKYRTLFETVNLIALTLDAQGRVNYVNPFFLKLSGYRANEVVGRSWFDFLPAAQRPTIQVVFSELLERDLPAHYDNPIVTRDGHERLIAWHNTVLRDKNGRATGTLSMGEDVTERRAAEGRLRDSEERFRQLAENLREAFFITEAATGQCLYVSPAYADIWGRSSASACAAPYAWAEGIHPDDREAATAMLRGTIGEAGAQVVMRVIQPKGAERVVRVRIFPVLDSAGAMYRIVGVCEDITELRETERRLSQAQKMEAVGQLAGGLAHDFNNLMAAVSVFTELAAGQTGAEQQASLQQVQDSVRRASALTRQLLTFSRRNVLQPSALDASEVIRGMEQLLSRLIGGNIDLVLSLSADTGNVWMDPGQLEQVVLNIALNARDAMAGGGRLVIATRSVQMDAAAAERAGVAAGRFVLVTLKDTGHGMTPEVRQRIFEPFFSTKGATGTGLGLVTVYSIVRRAEGHIAVESEPGQGTTFTVWLPAMTQPVAPARPARTAGTAPAAAGAPRGTETILLVEDDTALRAAASAVLSRAGYRVLCAQTGPEAVDAAAAHQGTIHLMITDMVLPGMDGRAVIAEVRSRRPDLKVLLTSGYTGTETQPAADDGNIPFLGKPFSASTLMLKVREVLDTGKTG